MSAAKTPDMLNEDHDPGAQDLMPQAEAPKTATRRQRRGLMSAPPDTLNGMSGEEAAAQMVRSDEGHADARVVRWSPAPPSCPPMMPPEVAQAIIDVMLNVDPVQKKGRNTEHNYKFVAVEDLLKEVQPEMAKAGLIVMQNEVAIRQAFDGNFIEIEYAFTLLHKSGVGWDHPQRQTGLSRLKFNSGKIDDKAYNKCHTSARKYFLMALFQIPTGDLADNDRPDRRDAESPSDGQSVRAPEPEEAVSAAKRWANAALRSISGFKELDPLRAWKAKYDATLAKLEETSPDDFKAVTDAFISKCETFAPGGDEEERDPNAPPF